MEEENKEKKIDKEKEKDEIKGVKAAAVLLEHETTSFDSCWCRGPFYIRRRREKRKVRLMKRIKRMRKRRRKEKK